MRPGAEQAGRLRGRHVVVVNWRDLDHSLAGGAELYAWQLARGLAESGARVTFVTAREPGQGAREQREAITVRRGGGPLGFYLFVLLWLLRHRRSIDAVADPACGLPSFSPLVLRRGTPVLLVVHHVHQAQFTAHFPAPVAAFGRWMERVAMRRVYARQRTVAVSPSTREEMRRQLGWRGAVGLLANGADLPGYDPERAVDKQPHRVVVLGRLVAHKRVDLALTAVARVLATAPEQLADLRVDVIGRGPEAERLADVVRTLGLEDRVTLHGHVDQARKDELLAQASVQICASDAEGWGQAVIDAASWGVPTIARDVPGLRDSIREGSTGWLLPADGPATTTASVTEAIVQGIAERLAAALQADADTRLDLARACTAWAERHDWARMRAASADLVADLIAAALPPSHHSGHATAQPDHQPRDARVAV